jgi:hypothetical protein
LQGGASFTYSHAIDDASDNFNLPGPYALPQNSSAPSERGSSNFDSRFGLSRHVPASINPIRVRDMTSNPSSKTSFRDKRGGTSNYNGLASDWLSGRYIRHFFEIAIATALVPPLPGVSGASGRLSL